ncbi:methyl-accepting chemotaxis protein [Pseudomonas syringae pv. coryli]|uniref:Methyl-accepting chemotaxis protein n=1 Tax=Pseudomonas syringae pv. coryli TaxID=317659 RepID=A0A0P9P480_9PSED|nr:Methyl-accepting chemotaxis protein [Pseudomonas syringae pv. coryli]
MRNNQPVTQHERTFPAEQRLISTTDTRGTITYCNDAFVDISGYSEAELVGAAHNTVRHPDVPPAVFEHMWTTLKSGQPWMGIVKNRCKNGDHYWVNAYVTPVLENRQVVGFESVRIKPTAEQIRRAEALYTRLNKGKSAVPSRDKWLPVLQDWLPFILVSQLSFLIGVWLNSHWGFALAAALSVPLGLLGLSWQQRGTKRLLRLAEQTTSDPLIAQMYTDSRGPQARLEMSILSQEARMKTCLTRLQDTAEHLNSQARQSNSLANASSIGLERQRVETEQVAAAINQMAATTQEVASHVNRAADATQQANELTRRGRDIAGETREAIQRLSTSVGETGLTVTRLAKDSDEIGGVVDVIKGIADQTNLLALNAAIEAARAGEQGRGFAVVADEVRLLAQNTGKSTKEIAGMIEKIQAGVRETVESMRSGVQEVNEGVEMAGTAGQAIIEIRDSSGKVLQVVDQISFALREQTAASQDVARNVERSAQMAEQNNMSVQELLKTSGGLKTLATSLQTEVGKFRL